MNYIICFITSILTFYSCSHGELGIHIQLISPPGATTSHSVSLIWEQENLLTVNSEFLIRQNDITVATTEKPFCKIKNLKADSLYSFQVFLKNNKNQITGKSNIIRARTKPVSKVFNIVEYGAIGDGKKLNTTAIQRAIDSCELNGTVWIPKGIFVTGALFVKSNMTLYLEKGAILKGSSELKDYPVVMSRYEGIEREQYASLINGGELCGKGIQNFSIRGKGILDGEGEKLFVVQKKRGKIIRGRIVSILNGENIYLEGVHLLESPSRGAHFVYCNGITVENITINTRYNPETGEYYKLTNGDGLTLGSSKNAYIFNTTISSQDDIISIKSGRNEEGRRIGKSSEHIRIFNCRFQIGLGVVTGSEMSGSIRDVVVSDCVFENTAFVAQLKAPWGRGGVIENIIYKNLIHSDTIYDDNMWFRGGICIDQYYGVEEPDYSVLHEVDENMPLIRDVWFENISLKRKNGKAIYICGRPEKYLRNINFKNIRAEAPEGFYGRFVNQLTLTNVKIVQVTGDPFTLKNVVNVNRNVDCSSD